MNHSLRTVFVIYTLALLLVMFGQSDRYALAQPPPSQYFPETGYSISGLFLDYWNMNGGLAQYGYPISDELQEPLDPDGASLTVQYFERALFERHNENVGTPYEVLLRRLGSEQYLQLYGPGGAPNQLANNDNSRFFPETGYTVGGVFHTYWEQHGGLPQQGYPISDQFEEVNQLDGKTYMAKHI